jgi:hypothetical protein
LSEEGDVSPCPFASLEGSSPFKGGPSGGYFTRAKKAWLVGKVLGLEYPGDDLDAIRGLEEEFKLNFCV